MNTSLRTIEGEKIPTKEFLLNLLLQKFSDLDRPIDPETKRKSAIEVGRLAVEYLKTTNQFKDQLSLCLKTFNGSNSNSFDSDFQESIKRLYEDQVARLGEKILSFSAENIHSDTYREFSFKNTYVKSFNSILDEYFIQFTDTVDEYFGKDPFIIRRLRLKTASNTTFKILEGKLRNIGQFACIDEAIRFIKIRIGLHKDKKYYHKTLVYDLDELVEDFLINPSSNEINQSKTQEDTDQLLDEAIKEYEIISKPKYLVDENLFRAALRKKINTVLRRN